ncbi:TetR family transcriptional regulator [Microlunatus endophyticus]|nr:TetR family transcriptional regulator [Microlunatus endophyticus]
MARWQPGARARLSEAALELYDERGFEQTMVADIAERAGVTARTFFRHYADKREVLFSGWSLLQGATASALKEASADATAMELVQLALDATAQLIGADQARARRRQAIIAATPELRERELIKYDALAHDLAQALHGHGIDPVDAALAAHTGLAIYRVAFDQWTTTGSTDHPDETSETSETSGTGALTDLIADATRRHQRLAEGNPTREHPGMTPPARRADSDQGRSS